MQERLWTKSICHFALRKSYTVLCFFQFVAVSVPLACHPRSFIFKHPQSISQANAFFGVAFFFACVQAFLVCCPLSAFENSLGTRRHYARPRIWRHLCSFSCVPPMLRLPACGHFILCALVWLFKINLE